MPLHLIADRLEQALHEEIAVEQVVHVDLAEYAIGSPRYNKLIQSFEQNQQEAL